MSMFNVKDGYVAYTEGSRWYGFGVNWEMVRRATERQALALQTHFGELNVDDYIKTGDFLIQMGEAEFSKEAALVNRLFPGYIASLDDLGTFVKNFNEILQGKEAFSRAVRNLKRAFSERDDIKNGTVDEKRHQLAPVISSLYRSKFIEVLTRKIYSILDSNKGVFAAGDLSVLVPQLEAAYKDTIFEALEESINNLSLEKDSYFGENGDYQAILAAFEQFKYLKKEFIDIISTRIPFENIYASLNSQAQDIYRRRNNRRLVNNKSQRTARVWSAINAGIRTQAGQLGGWAYEALNNAANMLNLNMTADIIEGGNVAVSGKTSTSNLQRIDASIILSFDPSMTEEALLELLESGPGETSNKNLLEAAEKYSEFNDRVLSQLTDSFIIHTSAKAYGMGENFKGFANDSQRQLSQLPSIISEKSDLAEKLVWAAYNSISGAVLDSSQEVIKDNIKLLIIEYMGKLFFDDWTAIGTSMVADAGNSLHVFALDGIQVPLSVMLIQAGRAIQSAASHISGYFRVNVSLPDQIKYPGSGYERWSKYFEEFGNGEKHLTNDMIIQAWDAQRDEVAARSSFSTHFLANFESFLNGLEI